MRQHSTGIFFESAKDAREFWKREICPAVWPEHLQHKFEDLALGDVKEVLVSIEMLDSLKQERERINTLNFEINNCERLNNLGIAAEKRGEINEALSYYEENVTLGYTASHSFERLMVIYAKSKDLINELRIVERSIEIFSPENTRRLQSKKKTNLYPVEKWVARRSRILQKLGRL